MKTIIGGIALAMTITVGACGDDGVGAQDGATAEETSDTSVATETSVTAETTTSPPDVEPDVEPDSETPPDVEPDAEVELDTDEPEVELDIDEPEVEPDIDEPEVEPDIDEPEDVVPEIEEETVVPPEDIIEVAEETVVPPEDVTETEITEPEGCEQEPSLPLTYNTLTGFSGGEDFAFANQYAYSVDDNGAFVREQISGSGSVVLPNLSNFAAGMARLPNGKIAVNDANSNSLVIIDITVSPVTKTTILGGLSYPNGIDVDPEGFLYVAEQDAGRVRRVDSVTGDNTIIADDMFNPNGVSWGPGYRTLYIGSFGGGTVHGIDVDEDGNFGEPYVYIALPGVVPSGPPINICKGNDVGGWCYTQSGFGGRCGNGPSGLECIPDPQGRDPLEQVCVGKPENATCGLTIASKTYSGRCEQQGFGSTLTCDINQTAAQPCFHQQAGSSCVSFEFGFPTYGTCAEHDNVMLCDPPDGGGGGGGLDGLNVDECGTVYVTEYIAGIIWRKAPGGPVQAAVTLPSSWIPNMHWGNGVGGWDEKTLYVADRDEGRMFGLNIGRFGKHTTVVWP